MATVSSQAFSSFMSYGRLSSKLYNICLPARISTIFNIMDTAKTVKVLYIQTLRQFYAMCIRILTDFSLYVPYRRFCNSNGDFS